MDTNETLLRAILATVARGAFPPQEVHKIVAPFAGSDKQLAAYNLCDGEPPRPTLPKRQSSTEGIEPVYWPLD